MSNSYLLSETYAEKAKIISNIESISDELNCKIETEDLYTDLTDLSMVFVENLEDPVSLNFWVINEEEFPEDLFIVNSKDYHIAISINYGFYDGIYLGLFLKKFLQLYPDMLLCDESCTIFHSASDVIEGKVLWLEKD